MTRRRKEPDIDAVSPVAAQILRAADDRARAQRLLRVSDEVLLAHQRDLLFACNRTNFTDGAGYIHQRVAALCSTRDVAGRMNPSSAAALEYYRAGLAAVAGVRS